MTTRPDPDDLHRIADALECIANHYPAPANKDDLARTITTAIRDAINRGQLPPNVLGGAA